MSDKPVLVRVRATVNLPNLPLGKTAVAPRGDEFVEMCIRSNYVVIEGVVEQEETGS